MAGTTEIIYISGIKGQRPIQNNLYSRGIGFFASVPDPTDADSVPNTSWWDDQWTCQQWITWHQANVAKYGQATANAKFTDMASQVSSIASDHFCVYEPSFANYFTSQGIDFDNFIASLFVGTNNVATAAEQAAQNVSQSVVNTSSILRWLLPISAVVAVIGVGIYVKNEYLDNRPEHTHSVSGKKKKSYGKR